MLTNCAHKLENVKTDIEDILSGISNTYNDSAEWFRSS